MHQDQQNGKVMAEEANSIYERATSGPLQNNTMLHFSWADYLEVWSTICLQKVIFFFFYFKT